MTSDIWRPNPGPQTEFIQASEFEVLFGGGRGGGKTDGLVIDGLGLNNLDRYGQLLPPAIKHPRYRGIILRSQVKNITEVIDRGLDIYPRVDSQCVWKAGKQWFEFGSGARMEIGHASDEADILKYRSREFQYIGWEELTEHSTSRFYEALLQCCRGVPEIPKRIRSTTNPSGPGQRWVKKRWNIQDDGRSVPAFCSNPDEPDPAKRMYRRFIRSLVRDNPKIDPHYAARLALIEDDDEREAMLDGSWKMPKVAGAIYQKEMEKVLREGRITHVPYDPGLPVETFWDIGANDTMAIWMLQQVGASFRAIDYYEDRFAPLIDYVTHLRDTGYIFGAHFLPHDAGNRRLGILENSSVKDQLEELGVRNVVVVPRVQSRIDGINITRRALSMVTFDERKCAVGLSALREYRWKLSPAGDSTGQPAHTWASNGADAIRQFAQVYYQGDLDLPAPTLPQYEEPDYRGHRRAPTQESYDWVV